MWTYNSRTGAIAHDGVYAGDCYSGRAEGLNNPDLDHVEDLGPIPRGSYRIGIWFDDPGGKGPLVARLVPDLANQMHGRAGFMIHGDNAQLDHSASDGCIIAAHVLRLMIANSHDTGIEVVAE